MPASSATRWSNKSTSVVLLGGETFTATDRRTEMLRKISLHSRRLRGMPLGSAAADLARKGRQDSLEAVLNRGIIPIHVQDQPTVTLHAYVQVYPNRRAAQDIVTLTGPGYSQAFAMPAATAAAVAPNAQDATLTGTAPFVADFAATDNLDAAATGAARATIT